jgi:transcriptional regulator with XRE-family HTH domain
MQSLSNTERMNLSNAKALRRAREISKVTRAQLGSSLGLSDKSVEKFENGRVLLDDQKISEILQALNMSKEDFKRLKKGKKIGLTFPPKSDPV